MAGKRAILRRSKPPSFPSRADSRGCMAIKDERGRAMENSGAGVVAIDGRPVAVRHNKVRIADELDRAALLLNGMACAFGRVNDVDTFAAFEGQAAYEALSQIAGDHIGVQRGSHEAARPRGTVRPRRRPCGSFCTYSCLSPSRQSSFRPWCCICSASSTETRHVVPSKVAGSRRNLNNERLGTQ